MKYELFYLVGASKEADLEKIKIEVEKNVIDNGGKFLEKMTIEKRRLSYLVKHETHGIYIARRFELEETENVKEINTKLNLDSNVLRFILSKADDLPELKSKEERMDDVTQKENMQKSKKEPKKAFVKEEKKEKSEEVKGKKVEETKYIKEDNRKEKDEKEKDDQEEVEEVEVSEKMNDDDIDKKLEEILNI